MQLTRFFPIQKIKKKKVEHKNSKLKSVEFISNKYT